MTEITQKDRTSNFKVSLVEEEPSLVSGDKQTWYRYVLNNGHSTIEGHRSGTLKSVTDYANQYTDQLNERNTLMRSKWSSSRKPVQTTKK